jgi:hypothetical protein
MKKIDGAEKTSEVINLMFCHLEPKTRGKILNCIDEFIIKDLGIKQDQIPWLNPKENKIEKYCNLLDLMRLCYAKVFSEYLKTYNRKDH